MWFASFSVCRTASPTPTVAFAEFDAVPHAMKNSFACKNPTKKWLTTNCGPQKTVPPWSDAYELISTMKKMFIDYDAYDPGSVVVSYKWFQARVPKQRRFLNVASWVMMGAFNGPERPEFLARRWRQPCMRLKRLWIRDLWAKVFVENL